MTHRTSEAGTPRAGNLRRRALSGLGAVAALATLSLLLLSGCEALFPPPDQGDGATASAASLDILVVLYRAGGSGISEWEAASLKEGLELARLFYWRNSRAQLNLNVQYLEVSDYAPAHFWPPDLIEQDLRGRGVGDNAYDAIYVISNSPDLACWADGTILGRTAIAVGRVCGVPYPGDDPDTDYTIAWCFTHEFQHNLDGVFAQESGHPEMLHGHLEDAYAAKPPSDHYDAGTHYDWQAYLLRRFDAYDDFASPWNGRILFVDSDGDGLPDDDPRVPMDERRLGSDPRSADTDGDGLSDLAEFAAGIFSSSDPRQRDTDGDGRADGVDSYPLYGFTDTVQRATPIVDGVLEEGTWTLVREGWFFSDDRQLESRVYAAWDTDHLYVAAETSEPVRLFVRVDGSGEDGMFEGGDTYEVCLDPGSNVPQAVGAQLLPHSGWQPFAALPGGSVAARQAGGTYVLEAAVPRELGAGLGYSGGVAQGLSLASGEVLGLDIVLGETRAGGDPADRFSGQKAYLSEPHTYVDVQLSGPDVPGPSNCLLENFNQDRGLWTEHDPNGRITVDYASDRRLEFEHWVRPEPGYVTHPYALGDFALEFDIQISACGGNAKVVGPGVADTLGTMDQTQNGIYVAYYAGFPTVSPRLYLVTYVDGVLEWGWGGNPPRPNAVDISMGTTYYVTVERRGGTVVFSVFLDSTRSAHALGSPRILTSVLAGNEFSYVYAVTGDTTPPEGNWEWTTGWIDNVSLCRLP